MLNVTAGNAQVSKRPENMTKIEYSCPRAVDRGLLGLRGQFSISNTQRESQLQPPWLKVNYKGKMLSIINITHRSHRGKECM